MNVSKLLGLLIFLTDCYFVSLPGTQTAPLLKSSQTSRTGGHTSSTSRSRSSSGWGSSSSRSRPSSSWGSSRPSSTRSRTGSSSSWGWGSSRNRGSSSYSSSGTPKKTSTARNIWNKIRGKPSSNSGHSSSATKKPSIGRRIYNKIRGKTSGGTTYPGSGTSSRKSTAGKIWDKLRGKNKPVTPRPSTFGSSGGSGTWGSGKNSFGSGGLSTGSTSSSKSNWKTKAKSMLKKLAGSSAARKVGKKLFYKISGRNRRKYNQQYGRNYWYGGAGYYNDPYRYHVGQNRMSEYNIMRCEYEMPVGSNPDDDDVQFEYDDGRPVQRIMFNCDKRYEVCCGLDCCPRQKRRWGFGGSPGGGVVASPLGRAKVVLGLSAGLIYSMLILF